MSETELDFASIAARVLQLEENQVVLKRYIAKLKQQLETYQQRFNERSEPRKLEGLMAEFATIKQRLNLVIEEPQNISEPPIEFNYQAQNVDFQYQLVFDRPHSRAVFMEALSVAQERVIIVCPWLNCNSINDELLQKFRDCLNRGCLIDIGWGYLGDRQNIGKGWRYNALADLQELAKEYPEQFCLDLLGTHENFLVCDSSFAMLGSYNLLTNGDQSAEKEVVIRTNDGQIVKQLIERFDSSEVLTEEEIESRFVASSDYLAKLDNSDLRDANLSGAKLQGVSLYQTNLSRANLRQVNLNDATLNRVDLTTADLTEADLRQASLNSAKLRGADLISADLRATNLHSADLSGANLTGAKIGGANFFENAKLIATIMPDGSIHE